MNTKRLLNVRETATFLAIAPQTIYNRVAPKAKKPFPIKPKKIGRSIRFDINDINAFLESQIKEVGHE